MMNMIKKLLHIKSVFEEEEEKSKLAEKKVNDIVAQLNGEDKWFLCIQEKVKECTEKDP